MDTQQAKADLWQFKDDIDSFKKRVKSEEGVKLSSNLADLRLKLKDLRAELKKATTQEQRLNIQTNIENVSKQVTQANRELNNFLRTGDKTQSVLWLNFQQIERAINRVNDSIKSLWLSWKNLENINKKVDQTTQAFNKWEISAEEYQKQLWNIEKEAQKLASWSLWWLWELLWSLGVTAWLTAVWSAVITLAGNLQQARIAFTSIIWSASEAEVLLKDLAEFAKNTPFELTGLREQSKLLLAYWFEAGEIIPVLESLGNISAWVWVDKLPRLTYALWQVRAAWKLTGQDLRQFTETWVNLGEELQKITGITEKITSWNVAELGITYEQVALALQNLWGETGRFGGLMEAQSQTLQWSFSNLKDSLNILWEQVGLIFVPALTAVVQGVNSIIEPITKRAEENPKLSGAIFWVVAAVTGLTLWAVALAWILPVVTTFLWWATIAVWWFSIALSALLWPIALVVWAIAAIAIWWTALWNVLDDTVFKVEKQTKSLKELEDQLKLNQKTQERLKKELDDWIITLDQYNDSLQAVKEEQKLLEKEVENTTYTVDELLQKIDDLSKQDLSTQQARDELARLKKEAQNTRGEVVALIETLNIAFKASKKQSDQARKNTESWKWALAWAWWVAWFDVQTINLQWSLLVAQSNLDKLESQAEKWLDELEKKAKAIEVKWATWWSKWWSRWWWGKSQAQKNKEEEIKALEKAEKEAQEAQAKREKERLEKSQKNYKTQVDKRKNISKDFIKAFDQDIKLAQDSIDWLTNKIKSANDELKRIQDAQLTEQEKLASQYVEIQAKLLNPQEGDDISKLQADLALINEYTTEAQRAEASRLSTLSEVQKVVEEIERLKAQEQWKEAEILELEKQKETESAILEAFNQMRADLEVEYTKLVERESIARVLALEREIAKTRELIKLQQQAGWSSFTPWSQALWQQITNNTSQNSQNSLNITVNWSSNPDAIVNEIKRQWDSFTYGNNK
jgi:tape measure domain-containing protein